MEPLASASPDHASIDKKENSRGEPKHVPNSPAGSGSPLAGKSTIDEHTLENLRVDEATLIAGLRYEDLSLYEKKSVLVSFAPTAGIERLNGCRLTSLRIVLLMNHRSTKNLTGRTRIRLLSGDLGDTRSVESERASSMEGERCSIGF
jgi:hypothetical protein